MMGGGDGRGEGVRGLRRGVEHRLVEYERRKYGQEVGHVESGRVAKKERVGALK